MKTTTDRFNANKSERKVAQVFHPGEYLRDELDERGWSQIEFADIVGRSPHLINEIIVGRRGITPETAKAIAAALGTSPDVWMHLDSAYQLSKSAPVSSNISGRAVLSSRFPVRDMINRHWIQFSDSVEVLQSQLLQYFEIDSVDDTPKFAGATKKRGDTKELTPNQLAWVYRVKHIAETVPVSPYSKKSLNIALAQLDNLRTAPEAVRHVPQILANCGVRLVVVEPLPSSKIDGVCLWLGTSPVIGLSLTLDRIDNFWFVLRHEIEHVLNGDGKDYPMVDVNLASAPPASAKIPEPEKKANLAAAEFCVPQTELSNFLARNQPIPSRIKVLGFARRLHIHEGIVAGQIERHLNRWNIFRPMLVPVRSIIIETALTDGYGHLFAAQS